MQRIFLCVLCVCVLSHVLLLTSMAEIKVYRSVTTDKKQIALTFDDGPHPSLTPKILEILERYDARAVIKAGHEVGNHTFTHPHLARLNEVAIMDEIGRCEDALEELAEYRPHLLRTPQGALTPCLEKCLLDDDYILVLWSLDTRDWDNKSTVYIVQTVLSSIKSGDIILMHDYIGYNSKTPEALEQIIPALLADGYEFVTVSALLGFR